MNVLTVVALLVGLWVVALGCSAEGEDVAELLPVAVAKGDSVFVIWFTGDLPDTARGLPRLDKLEARVENLEARLEELMPPRIAPDWQKPLPVPGDSLLTRPCAAILDTFYYRSVEGARVTDMQWEDFVELGVRERGGFAPLPTDPPALIGTLWPVSPDRLYTLGPDGWIRVVRD